MKNIRFHEVKQIRSYLCDFTACWFVVFLTSSEHVGLSLTRFLSACGDFCGSYARCPRIGRQATENRHGATENRQ